MKVDYSPLLNAASSAILNLFPLIIFALVLGLAFKWVELRLRPRGRRRQRYWNNRRAQVLPFPPRHDPLPARVPDAADQLRTVMKAEFKAQPLLNKSEARLFRAIDKMVLDMRPDWQVMAQVSLGEILRSEDKDAYACINSKRVDLLIVDEECRPLHAIEYQGGAHFKGAHATAARDAVKKEALRRAGIGYIEVVAGDTPAELRRVVERLVQRSAAAN
jgi:hypothetical protein